MSEISDKEVQKQLERSHRKRNLALEIAEDNEEPPAFALGRRSREIAVYTLLSDKTGKAIEWFADASEWFEEDWNQGRGEVNEPQIAM